MSLNWCRRDALYARGLAGIALLGSWGTALHAVAADTAPTQVANWTASAKASDPAFTASAERGRAFYLRQSDTNAEMASCAACHTANPGTNGRHTVTGKSIAAMAIQANPERFTDAAKTEKWFKRNCNDVLGRVCTPAEKADFTTFMLTFK